MEKESDIVCPAKTIKEEDLKFVVLTVVNDTFSKTNEIVPVLMNIIKDIVDCANQTNLKNIDIKMKEMQIKFLESGND